MGHGRVGRSFAPRNGTGDPTDAVQMVNGIVEGAPHHAE
jgi:hypothetical protein